MKKLTTTIFSILLISSITSYSFAFSEKTDKDDFYNRVETFVKILMNIKNNYVEEKSFKDLFDYSIEGMLNKLDPHSAYLTEKDFEKSKEATTGKFTGVGMVVQRDEKTKFIKVVSPIDDTPAQKAGMKSGDLVIQIDDTYVDNLSFNDGIEMLRGKPGTDVKLKVWRGKEKPFDVNITRAVIKTQSIKAKIIEDNIAHIKITQFQEKTTKDLTREIKKLNKNNKIKGYVIDLRNNPGGLLSQAVGVSDAFLEQGEIVSTRSRQKDSARRWNATKGDITSGKPIVVLVNRGSASASEIVAGSLQDHKRAIIVGQKTFGKGSVQSIIQISKNKAIKFTTARYYTPSGRSIQKLGIIPDVVIPRLVITKELEEVEYGENKLSGALSNKQEKKQDKISVEEKLKQKQGGKEGKSLNITDYPLARAIDTLKTAILLESIK